MQAITGMRWTIYLAALLVLISCAYAIAVTFVPPTPVNATTVILSNATINVSATENATCVLNAYSSHAVTCPAGVVAYFPFDEGSGTFLRNIANPSDNATIQGTLNWTSGKVGGALDFDANDADYVVTSSSISQYGLDGEKPFTVSMWANFRSPNPYGDTRFLMTFGYTGCGQIFGVGGQGNPLSGVFVWGFCGHRDFSDGPISGTFATGEWHQITVTSRPAQRVLYIDGAEILAFNSYPDDPYFNIGGPLNPLYIGKNAFSANNDQDMDGKIDEVVIFNRTLNASEVQQLYNTTASGNPICVPYNTFQMQSHNISANTFANFSLTLADGQNSLIANCTGLSGSNTTENRTFTADLLLEMSGISATVLSGEADALINWTTGKNANSTVDYGTTVALGTFAADSAYNLTHVMPLSGLTLSTLYYYNLTACTAAGLCNTTGPYDFRTDITPPSMNFTNPTPPDNSTVAVGTVSINVTVSENVTSCRLTLPTSGLWDNLRHLGISGGRFNYNASIGVNNYTSFTMEHRLPLAAGSARTCYLLSSGNSVCYGDNSSGQSTGYTGANAIAVAAGQSHTCYLLSSGNSACYGDNVAGQSTDYTLGDAIAVAAGYAHTCYLLSSGNSVCHGDNSQYQSTSYTGGDAIAVAAGSAHTCYLLSSGNSVCNGYYEKSTPYSGGDAIAVAAGDDHTCYLRSNGNSVCYADSVGETGDYTGGDAIAVAAADSFTCYLLSNGNSACYGDNSTGQSTDYTGGDAIAVAAAGDHTCYLLSNGSSVCYGDDTYGQADSYTGGGLKLPFAVAMHSMTAHNAGANTYANFTVTNLDDGVHTYWVNCTDLAGNAGSTENRSVNVQSHLAISGVSNRTQPGDTAAEINWTTDKAANSTVNYGTTPSLGTRSADSAYNLTHSMLLTGLTPNTRYYYNVTSCTAIGLCNATGPYVLITDTTPPSISFTSPTPGNGSTIVSSNAIINLSVSENVSSCVLFALGGAMYATINVSMPSATAPAGYQTKINLNESTAGVSFNWDANCTDLLFTNAAGDELPYWAEYCNATEKLATIWVKVDSPLNTSVTKIHMYPASGPGPLRDNGTATFEFFDDFNGASIDTSKWTGDTSHFTQSGGYLSGGNTNYRLSSVPSFTGDYVFETRHFVTSEADNGHTVGGWYASSSQGYSMLLHGYSGGYWYTYNDGSFSGVDIYPFVGYWVRARLWGAGSSSHASITRESDGYLQETSDLNGGLSSESVMLGTRGDDSLYGESYDAEWDWLFVRKYASEEPDVSVEPPSGSSSGSSMTIHNAGGSTFAYYVLPLVDGSYNISANCTDVAGNSNISQNRTFTADVLLGLSDVSATVLPGDTTALIDWTTLKAANSTVNYGTTTALGTFTADSTYNLTHSLLLTGLTPNTRYYYDVTSCTSAGLCNSTGPYTFFTDVTPPFIDFTSPTPGNGSTIVSSNAIINVSVSENATCALQVIQSSVSTCPAGVVAYFPFDEGSGTFLHNIANPSDNATIQGTLNWTSGKVGGALDFDANDADYVVTSSSISQYGLGGENPFTVSMWANFRSPSLYDNRYLITFGYPDCGQLFGIGGQGNPLYDVFVWGFCGGEDFNAGTIATGEWHQITVTSTSAERVLYIDGAQVGVQDAYWSIGSPSTPIYIGRDVFDADNDRDMDGQIDEVAIFNRTLNASEVQQLYNTTASGNPICVPSTTFPMQSNNNSASTYANVSLTLADGQYTVIANCTDVAGNSNISQNRTFTADVLLGLSDVSATVLPGDTTALIDWTTLKAANSTVNYGTTTALGTFTADSTYNLTHSLLLTGLTPNTRYYYDVISCTSAGLCNSTGPYTFFTDVTPPSMEFVDPTPPDASLLSSDNATINVTVSENVTSCMLSLGMGGGAGGLWNNVKHLNIYGGRFDYNASVGPGGYSSFTMQQRLPLSDNSGATCYLFRNGSSQCIGYDSGYGETTPYTGGDATALSLNGMACYILNNGNGVCYGDPNHGAINYTDGNAIAVAAGGYHACYLLSNGNSACYGDGECMGNLPCAGSNGQATNYTGGDAIAVAAGTYDTCYLLKNGNSVCYGDYYDIGAGIPELMPDYTGGDAIAVDTYMYHACYLLTNGNSTCYGDNYFGQSENYTGGNAIALSTGFEDTCYLFADGNSECIGTDSGNGETASYAGGDAIGISASDSRTCYLLSSGQSYCRGYNDVTDTYHGTDLAIPFATINWSMQVHNADEDTTADYAATRLAGGNWTYNVNCTDVAGNSNRTADRTFSVPLLILIDNASVITLPDETSATASWDTNLVANSRVDYGETTTLGSSASNGAFTLSHAILLNGLTPKTTYYYNLTSCTATGFCNTTGPYVFIANAPPNISFVSPTPADAAVINYRNVTFNLSIGKNVSSCILRLNSTPISMTINNADADTTANATAYNLPDGFYAYYANCTDPLGISNRTVNSTFTVDLTPPSITFVRPTPDDNATITYINVPINVSLNENVTSCILNINNTNSTSLWTNIAHLGISGGRFDYNASIGVGNYSSFNMLNRNPMALGGTPPGNGHACYLLTNGNSFCMGVHYWGDSNSYNGGDAIALSSGENHTCYLRSNGNSTCYGSNYSAEFNISGQATSYTGGDAIALSASWHDTCYLLSNGNAKCYGGGADYNGGDAIALSAGPFYTCYLLSNGNATCLGGGTHYDYDGGDAIGLGVGHYQECFLLSNGNSACYGGNSFGQATNYTGGDAIAVSAGGEFTCYLLSNGNSRCYGMYNNGSTFYAMPSYSGGDALAISSAYNYVCYLRPGGNSICYGNNYYGQAWPYLGHDIRIPFSINTDTHASLDMSLHNASAATSAEYTLMKLFAGTYGYNVSCTDVAGNSNETATRTFTLVPDVTPPSLAFVPPTPPNGSTVYYQNVSINVSADKNLSQCLLTINTSDFHPPATAVSAGMFYTCYLLNNGNSWCYGLNGWDQAPPYQGGDAVAVSATWEHTCYLLSNGNSACYGQTDCFGGYTTPCLGSRGPSTNYTGGDAIAVSTGAEDDEYVSWYSIDFSTTCYLLSNGNSTCYGTSAYGEGTPYDGGDAIAVSTAGTYTCYVLRNGNSACYGWNGFGQVINYTGGDAIAVSAGRSHVCYLLRNGDSACYGSNGYGGQATNYTGGDAVGVSSGYANTCYLLSNGNSTCYGNNDSGQLINYDGGNAIAVSVSPSDNFHLNHRVQICYLLNNGSSVCYGHNDYGEATNYIAGPFIPMNVTNASANTSALANLDLPYGFYKYDAECADRNGNSNKTPDWFVTVSPPGPVLTFVPPTPDDGQTIHTAIVPFRLSADKDLDSCDLNLFELNLTPPVSLATGIDATCYVLADGNSRCYGANYDGPDYNAVATPYTGANAIAASMSQGWWTTCYLLSNGNSACYGHNYTGQLVNYTGGNAVSLAMGWDHVCYLLNTSNHSDAVCYGSNASGQFGQPGGSAIALSAGGEHTCYLLSNGTSRCYGQFEDSGNSNTLMLNYTGGAAVAVSSAGANTCYLLGNGTSACYGNYRDSGDNILPVPNYPGGDAVAVATGILHTCYLLNNGKSACYGMGDLEQATNYTAGDAVAVSAGRTDTCYLLSNHNSACYGDNNNGQATNYTSGNAIAVSVGDNHVCYLLSNNNSYCHGPGGHTGAATSYTSGNAVTLSAGYEDTCYVLNNGNSVCYGTNDYGEGAPYTGGDAIAVSVSDGPLAYTCYLLSNGNSVCYGDNSYGQSVNYLGGNAIGVSTADYHTCYLLSNGSSVCYGYYYQGFNRIMPDYTGGDAINLSSGKDHVCYLLSNGNSSCYGQNACIGYSPCIGGGQSVNYTGGDAIAVAAGAWHTCYLRSNGDSACYGDGSCVGSSTCIGAYGEATNYTGGDAIAISAGYGHTCYLLTDNRSFCYGDNSSGQSNGYGSVPLVHMDVDNTGANPVANVHVPDLPNSVYGYDANCTSSDGGVNRTASRSFIMNIDRTPPSMTFIAPTPVNATIVHDSNVTLNATVSKNVSACSLFIYDLNANLTHTTSLWNNIRHLGIYGGMFDYNASLGVDNYSSLNMDNLVPIGASNTFTCYILNSGNSACYGTYTDGSFHTMPSYYGGDAVALATGNEHICYVRSNGNSVCFGASIFGKTTPYTGGNAIAASAGGWFTCYLLNNGNGVCYGMWNNGTLTHYSIIPMSANYSGGNAIGIAAGDDHVCYLLSNGNSKCYGRNDSGQAMPYTRGDAIGISAGNGFTCYLRTNGNATCYGSNDLGRATNYTGGNAIGMSSGVWHNCFLLSNGNSRCYGDSPDYTGGDAIGVATEGYHTCYLLSNGNSVCYGINDYGQSNGYTGGDLLMPFNSTTDVGLNMTVHNADAASAASLAIPYLADGSYLYWVKCTDMYNSTNANTSENRTLYVELEVFISNVTQTVLPDNTSVAVTWNTDKYSNSTVKYGVSPALGSNASSAAEDLFHNVTLTGLTLGTTYYYNVTSCAPGGTCATAGPFSFFLVSTPPSIDYTDPTPDNGTTVVQSSVIINVSVNENVSACNFSLSFAPLWNNVKHLGIYGGGINYNASMGAGGFASFNADNIRTVATGASHTCYLLSDGNSACYGDNTLGQATNYTGGDAVSLSAAYYYTCYLLSGGNSACYGTGPYPQNYTGGNATALSASGGHICYLLGNGTSICWGDNTWNQAINYTGGDAIALSTGASYTCYLLASGNSACYGDNSYGQSANYSGGDAIAVAAGTYHTCYLLSSGNSVCYGMNDYGQSANYSGGDALAVAAGTSHTCYLLASGNSVCYGDNSYNQSTNYAGEDAIEISSGSFQTCYVRTNGASVCYGSGDYGAYSGLDVKPPFAAASSVMSVMNANGNTTVLSTISNMKRNVTYTYDVACTNKGGLSNNTGTRDIRVASVVDVSSCLVINESGAYQLDTNLTGAPNSIDGRNVCIAITSSDVFLDCGGHTVTNDATANAYGVYVMPSTSGVEVDGCSVSGYLSGFALNQTGATLSANTVHGNSGSGIRADASSPVLSSNRYYNNTIDLLVNGNGTMAMTTDVFSAPAASQQNYTALSLNVTTALGEAYSITWSSSPAALPNAYGSFAQKFITISTVSGSPSLGSVVWSWSNAEAASYNESRFRLWEYNGSWSMRNASPDTSANTLSLSGLASPGTFAILQLNDTTPPLITLNSPANGSVSTLSAVDFSFTATDDLSSSLDCGLFVDGVQHGGSIPASNGTPVTVTVSPGSGDHSWFVQCTDQAGNSNSSETWDITVSPAAPPPQPPSGRTVTPSTCADDEQYVNGRCVAVSCTCGVVSNHQCTPYACCLDSGCAVGESCQNHACTAVSCTCGVVQDHQCVPYTCCRDSDCAQGESCASHACITTTPPPSKPPVTPGGACNVSDQCLAEQVCSNGVCSNVTGQCGYAAGHAWVTYACGPEPGCPSCPSGSSCTDHACVPGYGISAPDTGFVGEGVKVTAINGTGPCGSCEITWTSPSGRTGTGTTDANGTYVIPLNEKGTYMAVLANDPTKSASVNALSKPAPNNGQTPLVVLLSEVPSYLWLLVLLLIAGGAIVYLRGRGKAPKPPSA